MAEQQTADIWAERVRAWRESGQTARAFSTGRGFAASTLKIWSSRLRRAEAAPPVASPRRGRPPTTLVVAAPAAPAKALMLARVVRSEGAGLEARLSSAPVEVVVGDVRVRVERGADEAALRLVFRALGVAR